MSETASAADPAAALDGDAARHHRPGQWFLRPLAIPLAVVVLAALGAGDTAVDLERRLLPPSPGRWLGTDQLGRDILGRLVDGAGWTVGVGLGATLLAFAIGCAVGILAVEGGPLVRRGALQLVALVQGFPALVVALGAVASLGQGAVTVILVLGLFGWPVFARVLAAEAAEALQRDYVLAARIAGVRPVSLYLRHLLPAVAPSLGGLFLFHFADMLVAASALAFLGVGAPLGFPAWGAMLSESRAYLHDAPWMMLAPAAALAGTVLAVNRLGEALAGRLAGRSGDGRR
ncbi:ABC transporter permease [Thermaurantiacus tibetensis]|uniref:ABC transporter permease n=1 Tax=Thermaurantiacus tibetensis TaxID=2759035 RepID=UPI00188F1CE5|nr:ABC transporter permease [Thermaurantiacus tibetensis]